jgi:phage-related protein
MSTSFSLGSIASKNLIASDKTFLVAIEVQVRQLNNKVPIEILHLVSNNEDMILDGVEYTAFPFQVNFNYEAGAQASMSVTAQDVSGDLQARMQEYNGGVGFLVSLRIFHQDSISSPPDFAEEFTVISSSSNDYTVNWTLGAENLLDRNFPARRQYRDRCSFSYKSADCGYVGALPVCKYNYDDCVAHGNAPNYGGYPGLRNA